MSISSKSQMSKVVTNIRKVRHYRNYSQEYVASKIGISQHGYSKIENGMSTITVERLCQIADALEVKPGDLVLLNFENLQQVKLSKLKLI